MNETDPQPRDKRPCEALRTLEKQISRDLDNGINSQSASKITVNQAFENAMNTNQKKRPSTRTLQRGIYENHIRGQLGSLPLARISRDMMKDFYLCLYTEENLAPGTILTIYIVLNPLFEEQVKNGNLRVNNSSLALSDVKKLVDWETAPRHALTAKEQEAFVNFYSTTPAYSKWVPLLDVLLGTGMRIGEALSLTWNDIDWESNFISVNHTLSSARIDGEKTFYISVPKTAAGNCKIPMLGKVRAALLSEYEQQEINSGCTFELDGYKGFVFF